MDTPTLFLCLTITLTLVTADVATTDPPIRNHATTDPPIRNHVTTDPPIRNHVTTDQSIRNHAATAETSINHTEMNALYGSDEDSVFYVTGSPGCGATQQNGQNGSIQSPNYPSSYAPDTDCVWYIYVTEPMRIRLTFVDFDTETGYDFVDIYNGTNDSKTRLDGRISLPYNVYSDHNVMTVKFHSDGSGQRVGFRAYFEEYDPYFEITTSTYDSSSMRGRMTIGQGTSFRLEGQQLQVYHNGRWGTVCGDGFNRRTARGICYLIYGRWPSNVWYYRGGYSGVARDIWLDQLECSDSYYYGAQCTANYWGDNDCSHSQDVNMECFYSTSYEITTSTYDSSSRGGRMTIGQGTNFRLEGQQLQVYHNGRWGTVCDDGFNERTTRGICYLIYGRWPSSTRYYSGQQSTTSSPPNRLIWLDQLECTDIYSYYGPQCTANYWGVNDCSHSEDVSVECYFSSGYDFTTSTYDSSSMGGRMTIAQGTSFRLYGQQLQVYHDGMWGTVCDDGIGEDTVKGICKLIYGTWPSSVTYYTRGGSNAVPILLDDLECTRSYYYYDEPRCSANYWGVNNCGHSEDLNMACHYYDVTTVDYDTTSQGGRMTIAPGTQFRLEGGQLQVYHNGVWGSVCYDGLDMRTIRGMCYLIYGQWPSEDPYYTNYQYYSSVPIWLNHLKCTDDYYYGPQCSADYWGISSCTTVEIGCYIHEPTTAAFSVAPSYSSDVYVRSITVDCYPDAWNIMIYLPELYKRHVDFDPADIYLGRPGCQGYRVGNYLRIDQQYSNCDSHHFTTSGKVEYTNTLVYAYRDPNYKFIIREYRFKIDVECDMATHETVSQHFIETHNQVRKRSSNPHISGSGHYNMQMAFYRDQGYQQQMPGNPLTVSIGQDIYVSVTTPLSDYDVKMRVESCYTLPSPTAGDQLKFYLIKNGCTSDTNTRVQYLSSHETRFVFRDFEYSTNQDDLYLFCTATFCNVTDYSSACDQSCHNVKRRSVQSESRSLLRRSVTSGILHLSKGRSRRDVGDQDKTDNSVHAQYISVDDHLFIAVIVSAIGISMIAAFVAIRRYRKPKSKPIDTI
ncbi:deleted in malignant brain tumors 1 protein-like isoform X1 [Pecten maximus]|uniref:deleted in malignant brain tumors 1 protein-like isoform X1 n=1 Tax=Pecten maximus TaxID=6579 RepID=UPI001458C129|nr:deleted in malignant brain tumors 1 protein-like isoform X1 [Pecten maximus]